MGWLENNITASLVSLFPTPRIITRNDSLYRRLYILFLCFHVRQAFRDVRRQKQKKIRIKRRKNSNNTSIQSIVTALRVIFMEAARAWNSFSIAIYCFYYDAHYHRPLWAEMKIYQGLKLLVVDDVEIEFRHLRIYLLWFWSFWQLKMLKILTENQWTNSNFKKPLIFS